MDAQAYNDCLNSQECTTNGRLHTPMTTTTKLPCVLCGRNVSSNQVVRNRQHNPPLNDNLCKQHAAQVAARAQQLATTTPTPQDGLSFTDHLLMMEDRSDEPGYEDDYTDTR